jgi:hypothetical protein
MYKYRTIINKECDNFSSLPFLRLNAFLFSPLSFFLSGEEEEDEEEKLSLSRNDVMNRERYII